MMAKYDALTTYLRELTGESVDLPFSDVADVVGELPPSAYGSRSWWSNTVGRTNVHSPGWINAGWQVERVDLEAQRVTFRRVGQNDVQPGSDSIRVERMHVGARRVVDEGLARDGSVFTPGARVWTLDHANELMIHYVEALDTSGSSFFEKLTRQLAGASDGAVQLMAELLYLNTLPLNDFRVQTKRSNIGKVLNLMTMPPDLPDELSSTLDAGAFNGGVAFKTSRWAQLAFLVQFVVAWKSLGDDEQRGLLEDAFGFRDFVSGVSGQRTPSQRGALVYLVFPESFQPIVSIDHKKRICAAFADRVDGLTGDLDRDLERVRLVLEEEAGGQIDFYAPPWRDVWQSGPGPAIGGGEPAPMRRAWFISSGEDEGVVSRWIAEGWCSRPGPRLDGLAGGVSRGVLIDVVEASYGGMSYSRRAEKVDELDMFVNQVHVSDLVVAVLHDRLHIGAVADVASASDAQEETSRLLRTVDWHGRQGFELDRLPGVLRARLGAPGVIELTPQLDLPEALLGESDPPSRPRPLELRRASEELAAGLLVPQDWLQECVDLLSEQRQLILYGPPGTGKTYLGQRLAWHLAGRERTRLVQFHPAYSYEDFFEGYRPSDSANGTVGFTLTPGPFRRLVDQAREDPAHPHVLLVDEINRGNLAKIFGELYFLLEYRDEAIDLLYGGAGSQAFTLPENVFVIGTMNTADRSIALVDTAMRRRFAFMSLHPSIEPAQSVLRKWLGARGLPADVADLYKELNRRIEDPDMKVGPSYLMRDSIHREAPSLERVWRTSILPLLDEHHYGEGVDVVERYGLPTLRAAVTARSSTEVDAGVDLP